MNLVRTWRKAEREPLFARWFKRLASEAGSAKSTSTACQLFKTLFLLFT
jgi:hypothetical protein